MIKKSLSFILFFVLGCNNPSSKNQKVIPNSSGNINTISVVMPEKAWRGTLGNKVRDLFQTPYEGLPFDEPQFSLKYLNPKVFSGFAKQSRNILWFVKDSLSQFQMLKDAYARPQIVSLFKANDEEEQAFYLEENISLIRQSITENERIE